MKGLIKMKNDLFRYDPDGDYITLEEIASMQETLMRKQLAYCRNKSPYYSRILKDVDVENFALSDLSKLPLTEKSSIASDPDRFVCVERKDIGEIVFTSGTTGDPCKIIYSNNDMQRLRYNEERCFSAAGVNAEDIVLLTCTGDRCFIAGMAYYLGARSVGAAAVRNGLNSVDSHLDILRTLHPTVIVGVPSFLRHLGEAAHAQKLTDSVRKLICIGEPVRDKEFALAGLGSELGRLWNAQVHSTYASSEIVSSFCECEALCGGHLLPDLVIAEIIDEKGNVLNYGEIGELVLTQLNAEGMPFIRFRTGDITFLTSDRCSCGRFSPRLGPILGRKSQLLKCKGTSIYPQGIYNIMNAERQIADFYLEVSGEDLSDHIEVFAALKNSDHDLTDLKKRLFTHCRMSVPLHIVPAEQIQKKVFGVSRKPVRFHDLRKKSGA